jgi:hypothetical protein
MKQHVLTGDLEQRGVNRKIAVFKLSASAKTPAVMVVSYTGGAHCCTHVQLAVPMASGFRTVDLGSIWDGDTIDYPTDLSGDGVPDLLFPDPAFLYTFTAYAYSQWPPIVKNVVDGEVVDVSARPEFRLLYRNEMKNAEQACRDIDPPTSAGGCPAFVAAAARAGSLDEAWRVMIHVHRPDPKWELPEYCSLEPKPGCKGRYRSYPDALEALLKAHGYAPKSWHPPAAN